VRANQQRRNAARIALDSDDQVADLALDLSAALSKRQVRPRFYPRWMRRAQAPRRDSESIRTRSSSIPSAGRG
jgi:hypothetical protein